LAQIELNAKMRDDLSDIAAKFRSEEKLLTDRQLKQFYQTFRERFGPEELRRLDNAPLLDKLHNHNSHESLVYWLEYKDDEEFPTSRFGSILGGSALKFGIFVRKETGSWMGRTPGSGNVPIEISVEEAVNVARKHRDQLLAGIDVLQGFPRNGSDTDYEQLQAAIDSTAPDVGDSVWGHKYFTLLFPDILEDYHTPDLQRFHLIKLLQVPRHDTGRYVLAGRYVDVAAQFRLQMNQLTTVLNARHGRYHRYWRIGTTADDGRVSFWPAMKDGSYVAIGWHELGDVSSLVGSQDAKNELKRMLGEVYEMTPQVIGKKASEISRFLNVMEDGDLVVTADGNTILGVGRVGPNSRYRYEPTDNFPHRRAVTWLDIESWTVPRQEALRTTCRELKFSENLVEIERRIVDPTSVTPVVVTGPTLPVKPQPHLTGIPGRIQSILERKGQVILYGPPGTGKTFWAERTAKDLVAYSEYGQPFAALNDDQKAAIQSTQFVRTCTFHPAYGYEDFLEGYRPESLNGQLTFNLRDGIFKKLCNDAKLRSKSNYYLVIDEINRGDIPRIFGELLTVMEKPKRGNEIHLAISGGSFHVPRNVFLIGTMNTADRSIALLDKALRRRFGFVEFMPDATLLDNISLQGIALGRWLDCINRSIRLKLGRDARNLQIGHSYFMEKDRPLADFGRFVEVLQDEIIPLLEEYCYEDYTLMGEILGKGLVDTANQVIREELFEDSRRPDLIQALLAPYPDIETSRQAVTTESQIASEGTDEAEPEDDKEQ
jgi:5-methylcytosine-specific restriction protein B